MKFKKRLMTMIGVLVGIVLLLAGGLFFLGSDIQSRADKIGQLRSELTFRLQSTDSLASLQKEAEQSASYVSVLENFLPSRDQLVTFGRDMLIIGQQNKVDVSANLGKEIAVQDGDLRKTDFTMTIDGPLDNLINFLKSIEGSRYLNSIQNLDITKEDSSFKALLQGQLFSF